MTIYELIHEPFADPDLGEYWSYGIKAIQNEFVCTISDISLSKDALSEFVDCCNRCGASITHFRDLVDDFLA